MFKKLKIENEFNTQHYYTVPNRIQLLMQGTLIVSAHAMCMLPSETSIETELLLVSNSIRVFRDTVVMSNIDDMATRSTLMSDE
jgi:hypothetical protein